MSYPVVELRNGREKPVDWRHPWLFSGAVAKVSEGIKEGTLVQVVDRKGKIRGNALYGSKTIALKFLTFEDEKIDRAFFEKRFRAARQYREQLGLFSLSETNGFRLFFGEADGVPGLVIDRYDSAIVLQFQEALEQFENEIRDALLKIYGDFVKTIYLKGGEEGKHLVGKEERGEFLESDICYISDWKSGQKTGFFLDQRENRKLLKKYSNNKRVLNCFSYTGGFSISAAIGGASEIISVDSSGFALEILQQNLDLNGIKIPSTIVKEDCFDYLDGLTETFDVVVIDPPAFVKHRAALEKGIKGYRQLNISALKCIKPGGFIFTFSCSQLVSRDDFREMIFEAVMASGKRVTIVHELHQAPCHPLSVSFPEGEYLKGLVLYVSEYD